MITLLLKKITQFILIVLPVFAIAGSSSSVSDSTGSILSNASLDEFVLVVTLIGGLLTILTVAIKAVKPTTPKVDTLNELKIEYTKLAEQVTDLTKLDVAGKIRHIEHDISELDDTVNKYLKQKLYILSENFTILETKVVNMNKNFDEFNRDRREENAQLKAEINTLRENIREDINDVKDIIMKLMMALKTEED
jgi:hypothetical protein